MNRGRLIFTGFILAMIGELLAIAGIAITSQLITQSDPVAKHFSGVFIGILLIMFGIMIAFYRVSESD